MQSVTTSPWQRGRHTLDLRSNRACAFRNETSAPPARSSVRFSRSTRSLVDALFTATQQRVLALLFGQPNRSFYASEMIERTGSGSGAVQRELKRLASSGLVTVKRIGNQLHYQANPDAPVFEELCGLVKKTVAPAEPIRESLVPLADRVSLAILCGSVPSPRARTRVCWW